MSSLGILPFYTLVRAHGELRIVCFASNLILLNFAIGAIVINSVVGEILTNRLPVVVSQ